MLVLPELNALAGVWPQHLTVEADVRDMPGVWLSADHQVSALPETCLIVFFLLLWSFQWICHCILLACPCLLFLLLFALWCPTCPSLPRSCFCPLLGACPAPFAFILTSVTFCLACSRTKHRPQLKITTAAEHLIRAETAGGCSQWRMTLCT